MSEQTVQFKISRFKQGQAEPGYQTFEVVVDEDTTALVALQEIRREQDPSLMLRHSCHHASCGTCGMKINGREELACVVNVLALDTPTVLVEPIENHPVISDLVVDMRGFFEVYNIPQRPYVQECEFLAEAVPPPDVAMFTRYENCIECGLCVSACPIKGSDPAYLGPAALAAAWRVVEEPRGSDPEFALQWADHEHGCWRCHVAYECTEICPTGVDPGGKIMALRNTLARRKLRRLFGRG